MKDYERELEPKKGGKEETQPSLDSENNDEKTPPPVNDLYSDVQSMDYNNYQNQSNWNYDSEIVQDTSGFR